MVFWQEPMGMDIPSWLEQRQAVAGLRQGPRRARTIRIAALGDGSLPPNDDVKPTDVYIEATDPDGEISVWFDDWWWMECLSRWKDDVVTMHILPTPAALLHPVILHHVEMARRVAPQWRVVGHCWLEELDPDSASEAIARSPYHEIRVIEAPVPDPARKNPRRIAALQDLIRPVRQLQRESGRTLPILVRASVPVVPMSDTPVDRPAFAVERPEKARAR